MVFCSCVQGLMPCTQLILFAQILYPIKLVYLLMCTRPYAPYTWSKKTILLVQILSPEAQLGWFKANASFESMNTWTARSTFSHFHCLKIRRSANCMLARNVVQRILKLQKLWKGRLGTYALTTTWCRLFVWTVKKVSRYPNAHLRLTKNFYNYFG